MTVRVKKSRIVSKIKREVMADNAKLKKAQMTTGKAPIVCGDSGCSEANCSTYCSES